MANIRPELRRGGLTREQIYERADKFRLQVLDFIIQSKGATAKQLAAHFKTDVCHVRDHADTMVKLGCLRKTKPVNEIVFVETGKPYEHKRKEYNTKAKRASKDSVIIPEARVFRLLDRKPHEISKEEHEFNRRRSQRSVFTGSTMGMFDGY